jgi:RHS repeat-associated protein
MVVQAYDSSCFSKIGIALTDTVQGINAQFYFENKDYTATWFSVGWSSITDASGKLLQTLSYDPWGRRRNPNNWNEYNVSSTLFDRGFTGHEHLDAFGLINMNGRVYDPYLARFLSPDPFIAEPHNAQNYNRYSYALNNPLRYTDPSGYYHHYWDNNDRVRLHIEGSSGAYGINDWSRHMRTGGLGPGSGNHWSDQFRSEWGNFMLGNQSSYDRMYGRGAYTFMAGYYTGDNNLYTWNSVAWNSHAGNEVDREIVNNGVNVYYSGAWVRANPFTGPTLGSSIPFSGRVEGGNSFLNSLNDFNTCFGAGLFGADRTLSATRIGRNIGFGLAYTPFARVTNFVKPLGYGTSFVGFGIGIARFTMSDYSWGDYGQLGVSFLSSGLSLGTVTAPFGIALGAVDMFGGFNSFYNYLDEQEQFYNSTGGIMLQLNHFPVFIPITKP